MCPGGGGGGGGGFFPEFLNAVICAQISCRERIEFLDAVICAQI